jgi:hypothetical protein
MCHSPGTPLSVRLPRSAKRKPEPATKSFTVLDTKTSCAPASEATRAPMWTAMPPTSSPIISPSFTADALHKPNREAPFAWNGKFAQHPCVNIRPRPLQQPSPPVWVTGIGNPKASASFIRLIASTPLGRGRGRMTGGNPAQAVRRREGFRRSLTFATVAGHHLLPRERSYEQ